MRLVLVIIALSVGLLGCPPVAPGCPTPTGPASFDLAETQDDALVAGKPRTFAVSMPDRCDGAQATSVSVSVTDGNLNALPSSGVLQTNNGSARAIVTFKAPQEGRFHLTVSFEPNLAIVQRDLVAGIARDDVQAQLASLYTGGCVTLALTQHGSIVCGRGGGNTSTVWRSGKAEEAVTAETLSVAGNTVWVTSKGEATRYIDDGTQLVKTDGPYDLPTGEDVLLGGDTFVWFADGSQTTKVHKLDRSGERTSYLLPGIFAEFGSGQLQSAVTPEGALLLGTRGHDELPNLCRIEAKADAVPRCVPAADELIGADAKGFWLIDSPSLLSTSRILQHVMIDATGEIKPVVARALLPPSFPLLAEMRPAFQQRFTLGQIPVFGVGTVPVRKASGITFEVWPAPTGAVLLRAYDDVVFSLGDELPLKLHVRQRRP